MLLVVNLKKFVEVFHGHVQVAKIVNVREFNVIENLFAFAEQIVVKFIA